METQAGFCQVCSKQPFVSDIFEVTLSDDTYLYSNSNGYHAVFPDGTLVQYSSNLAQGKRSNLQPLILSQYNCLTIHTIKMFQEGCVVSLRVAQTLRLEVDQRFKFQQLVI